MLGYNLIISSLSQAHVPSRDIKQQYIIISIFVGCSQNMAVRPRPELTVCGECMRDEGQPIIYYQFRILSFIFCGISKLTVDWVRKHCYIWHQREQGRTYVPLAKIHLHSHCIAFKFDSCASFHQFTREIETYLCMNFSYVVLVRWL